MSDTYDTALLMAVFDAAVDAIIVSDKTGQITRANKAASKLFGYTADQMIGQSVNMLMPEAMARHHDGFITHHIETGEKRIIDIGRDVEGLRKDGKVFPLHLSVGKAIVAGEMVFIGILHDLTNRRMAEEALSRSQRLDAIGQMTGGIAHDFNNLLTVVIGNLELLGMRIEDDKIHALLSDALEAAELGADLTSRLMIFARQNTLSPETLDINAVCKNALVMLRRILGPKYEIETRFGENLSTISADSTQFQTSIVNLALNAKDAMPKGGKLVFDTQNVEIDDTYIAQETDILPGSYVRLSITDTGAGMTPAAQKRALEPFFTTKPSGKGTGLGLSMVYGFVRQSGGHITLYSEVGYGTTISLYFPAQLVEVGGTAGVPKKTVPVPRGNGQLILVVEDNPQVRRLSVQRIRDLGFRTVEAATGDAAYDLLAKTPGVDLVFTDLIMPGQLSGYDLAHKVRADYPDIKILLTTGYADDLLQGNGFDMFSLLRKPYRQADLAMRLQALFMDASTD